MKHALFTIVCPAMLLSAVSLCTKTALLPNDPLADGSNAVIPAADTIPPVIIFNGGIGVNKDTVIIRQGDPEGVLATTARVSATDTGSITSPPIILTSNGIFTSQCGVQQVTYTATDAAGNSTSKTRIIIVDCDPPVITLIGDNPLHLPVGGTYTEPGATAIDNFDGAVTFTITGTVQTANEHIDTITYSALDRAGNIAKKKRAVIVGASQDAVPPVIVLIGSNPFSVRAGNPYVEPGWTAYDTRDGNLTANVVVTGGPVETSIPGRDTLVYTVSNQAGHVAVTKRIIIVLPSDTGIDTIPPVIALIGGMTMVIRVNDTWEEPGWVAYDIMDGDITMKVRVTEASGKPLPVVTTSPATYTFIYSVSDSAGNSFAVSREVKIVGTGVIPRGLSSALEAAGK